MIRFKRTTDSAIIKSIVTHPQVWPYVIDDFSPPAEQFTATESPLIWYVLAYNDETLLGLWTFAPQSGIAWEVHTTLLPHHGFHLARAAGRQVIEWIWANTSCRRIFTNVPSRNRIALKFAEDCGLTRFGVNEHSFQRGGKVYDQILLGVTRPEGQISCLSE